MSQLDRLLKSYIPMSEASFLLLSSLLEENHGYGIMQKVSQLTGGRVNLGAGTVYTILYKMENDGLISVAREVERRKVYQITPLGKQILGAEMRRIKELSKIADQLESREAVTV